jgi:hypothetical protein
MESYKEEKTASIVKREKTFFKSSPVDEYHLPQMNSEKVLFGGMFSEPKPYYLIVHIILSIFFFISMKNIAIDKVNKHFEQIIS